IMDQDDMDKTLDDPLVSIKQEHLSRDNAPFPSSSTSAPPQSRHNTPVASSPIVEPDTPHCSQESGITASTEPTPDTPVNTKLEDNSTTITPLIQDSPSNNNPSSSRRKKRKSRRGKGILVESSQQP